MLKEATSKQVANHMSSTRGPNNLLASWEGVAIFIVFVFRVVFSQKRHVSPAKITNVLPAGIINLLPLAAEIRLERALASCSVIIRIPLFQYQQTFPCSLAISTVSRTCAAPPPSSCLGSGREQSILSLYFPQDTQCPLT